MGPSLESIGNLKVEAIPQSHAATLTAASRPSTYSSPYNALNIPIHRSNIQSPPAASSSSTYSSPYNALNVPINQSSIQGHHEAVPGPAGNLPIQQGNPPNPFNASGSRGNDPNPLIARPVAVFNVPVRQNNIQIPSQAAPGPAGGLNIPVHQNIALNAPAAPGPAAHPMAVVVRPYSFLISGSFETGPLASNVPPELQTIMGDQILRWNSMAGKGPWHHPSVASMTRCVDTRRRNLSKRQNPLVDHSDGNVACGYCISKNQLCVLIGSRGPIIVPLPASN